MRKVISFYPKLLIFCFVFIFSNKIHAQDKKITNDKYEQIISSRRQMSKIIIDRLKQSKNNQFLGEKHLCIKLLGELRDINSCKELINYLLFTPTNFESDEVLPKEAYHPAAMALVKIGVPSVQFLTRQIMHSSDKTERKLAAWCIKQILKKKIAVVYLENVASKKHTDSKKRLIEACNILSK